MNITVSLSLKIYTGIAALNVIKTLRLNLIFTMERISRWEIFQNAYETGINKLSRLLKKREQALKKIKLVNIAWAKGNLLRFILYNSVNFLLCSSFDRVNSKRSWCWNLMHVSNVAWTCSRACVQCTVYIVYALTRHDMTPSAIDFCTFDVRVFCIVHGEFTGCPGFIWC